MSLKGIFRYRCRRNPGKLYNAFCYTKVIQRLGRWGDLAILSPGISPEQPLQETGLHDPLHGRQACSESNSFHILVGLVKYVPSRGYCRVVPSQNGDKSPRHLLNDSSKQTETYLVGERKQVLIVAFFSPRLVRHSSSLYLFTLALEETKINNNNRRHFSFQSPTVSNTKYRAIILRSIIITYLVQQQKQVRYFFSLDIFAVPLALTK